MGGVRTVVVLGCVSAFPHGRHQLATLREEAARRGLRLVGADDAARLAGVGALAGASAGPEAGGLAGASAGPEAGGLAGLETVAVPLGDPAGCARALAPLEPAAVLTYREAYVLLTAQVAGELGLRGNDPEAVALVRYKDRMRRLLTEHGYPQPASYLVASVEEALDRADFAASPRWVVKPRDGSGSEGVAAVTDVAGLTAAAGPLAERAPFVLEEFVEGPEFSAEGIFLDGEPHVLALTAKRVSASFVELGHRMPAALAPELERAARTAVEGAMRLSGLRHGVFHTELWLSGGRPVLGEAHVRPGGDYLHLLLAATRPGLELYGALLDDLLGQAPDLADLPPATRYAGIDFLELPPGTVRRLDGWAEVLSTPGLLVADLTVAPGDHVESATDSTGRHGCLAVAADTAAEVEALLRRAREALEVQVS